MTSDTRSWLTCNVYLTYIAGIWINSTPHYVLGICFECYVNKNHGTSCSSVGCIVYPTSHFAHNYCYFICQKCTFTQRNWYTSILSPLNFFQEL